MQVMQESITYVTTQVHITPYVFPFKNVLAGMMQVQFTLSSSLVFSRTDMTTDSERFYDSTLKILEDPEEQQEVQALMKWWNMWALYNTIQKFKLLNMILSINNRHIFPNHVLGLRALKKDCVISKIREKRARAKAAAAAPAPAPQNVASTAQNADPASRI